MTVTDYKKVDYTNPQSNHESENEQLISSTTTSEIDFHIEPIIRQSTSTTRNIQIFDDLTNFKKYRGKKKQRRIRNTLDLHTLIEEDENDPTQFVKLTNDYNGPFTRLLKDQDALNYWQKFTIMSEEKQRELLANTNFKTSMPLVIKVENPLLRISSKIKRAMKLKRNISEDVIEDIEEKLIGHFNNLKSTAFRAFPNTSFERFILHAIAQYHNLKSTSFLEMCIKCVEVTCPYKFWIPMEEPFHKFMRTLRN